MTADIRLTQYASGGGCACKIPPGEPEEAVARLLPAAAQLLPADAQTSGGLLVAGEVPGAPVIGELRPQAGPAIMVR